MGEERKKKVSTGKSALRACKAHAGSLLLLALAQIFFRVLALAPIFLLQWLENGENAPDWQIPSFVFWTLGGLIWIFLVSPMRFWAGEKLRTYSAPRLRRPKGRKPYFIWLRAGLMRLLRGLLWGLPFLGGLGLFLYGMEYLPYNEMGMLLQKLVLIGEPTTLRGLIVAAALLLIFLVLFLLGWRRDLPMEYLPARTLGVGQTLVYAAKVRRRGKGKLLKNSLFNTCYSLPAILGAALVLLPYAQENMRVSSNALRTVQSLLQLVQEPLPLDVLCYLMAVAVVLYLPLCIYRKMRSAVLVRRLTSELNVYGGRHAAG